MPPELTIVVPTYNERERLSDLVAQILDACTGRLDVEIIIVDDNSPDGTGAHADRLASDGRLRVIHRVGKLGLGSAVIEGFRAARGAVVGAIDADLSHPPRLIPELYAALIDRDLDMVVASRYVRGGGSDGFAWYRRLMSRAGCWLSRSVTPVRDSMSGFFLIRRECFLGMPVAARGFKIGLELLVRARLRTVGEVPYRFSGRIAGSSKLDGAEILTFLRQLVTLTGYARSGAATRVRYLSIAPAQAMLAPRAIDEVA